MYVGKSREISMKIQLVIHNFLECQLMVKRKAIISIKTLANVIFFPRSK